MKQSALPTGRLSLPHIRRVRTPRHRVYDAYALLDYIAFELTQELTPAGELPHVSLGQRLESLEAAGVLTVTRTLRTGLGIRNALQHADRYRNPISDQELSAAAEAICTAVDALLPHAPRALAARVAPRRRWPWVLLTLLVLSAMTWLTLQADVLPGS